MIYTAIDTFYLTDEQLKNSPSRKDGIDEETETNLRIYGCDLIQESGILLRLPQQVMATGQVLFHRFYCKKSFARFNVKRVAASCVWLASKLEESPRKGRQVIMVFHRMECRRENLSIEHMDAVSKKYAELKMDLNRTERHLLKEMGFICHVEHPHKFISNYLATLETPPELRQEAWNLANDSLRTMLCVRFKSEVVACGVVYAAARRFKVPLPENPPWWLAFDADQSEIEEVCRVLAHLYSLPKALYVPVCKDNDSFATISKAPNDSKTPTPKESLLVGAASDTKEPTADANSPKDSLVKATSDKSKELKKNNNDVDNMPVDGEAREDQAKPKSDPRTEMGGEKNREREKDRSKSRERDRGRDSSRGSERDRDTSRGSERDRELERDREKTKDRRSKDRGKDSGYYEKSRDSRSHSSRDRSEYHSSHSSREKDRHRHHPY
ncbi:Cyclin-L1-1 [Acorus gramineus]|uniref:Cyclin-L1-1 n=1 Tax=Acorus gramineus TaxID=55184 RepID=A0AAV9AU57_ACOGR|nr:Cyclin-L1-1 [Acorus gramineus]